jgi:hypothetical protein
MDSSHKLVLDGTDLGGTQYYECFGADKNTSGKGEHTRMKEKTLVRSTGTCGSKFG